MGVTTKKNDSKGSNITTAFNETIPQNNTNVKYSLNDVIDNEYLEAVKNNDLEAAQKLVDEAAKENGYTIKAYHGTTNQQEKSTWKEVSISLSYLKSDAEIATFAAVPKVLKRGIEIDHHKSHKDRGYDSWTFAAPVIINGKSVFIWALFFLNNITSKYSENRNKECDKIQNNRRQRTQRHIRSYYKCYCKGAHSRENYSGNIFNVSLSVESRKKKSGNRNNKKQRRAPRNSRQRTLVNGVFGNCGNLQKQIGRRIVVKSAVALLSLKKRKAVCKYNQQKNHH